MHDKHDMPCWDDEECGGTTSCSFYLTPKPHLYCHKCEKFNYNKEEVEEYTMTGNVTHLPQEKKKDTLFPLRGVIAAMDNRKISKDTAEKYGVEKLFNGAGDAYGYSFPAYSDKGEFLAQKIKQTVDKRMKWLGDKSTTTMFGMRAFSSGGKYITITEGEEDAMSAYQILKSFMRDGFEPPVISVNDGVGSAAKDCKKHWEYLDSFETIVVCFDGDEPGQAAAEKVAKLFPHKVKIVNFPNATKTDTGWKLKDANDYLKDNKAKEFHNLWYRAEKYTPKGVLSFKSLWGDMTREEDNICVPYPFPGLQEKLHGLRTGELVMIKAPPKIGKTQILRELAYHIRSTTEHNTGLIFLEETKKRIGMGLCALHMNKPIQNPTVEFEMGDLKEAHEYLSQDDRLMVFDPQDERTAENIFNKIRYFVKAHDCKFIFLDHVSMLAYGSENMDERRFLDKLLNDLKQYTNSLNIGIVAVTHVNDEGKTRGSRASVQLCDAMISLQRDKLNPDPIIANTTEIIVEENRITGESGLASKVVYDHDTGRMYELDAEMISDMQQQSLKDVKFDD